MTTATTAPEVSSFINGAWRKGPQVGSDINPTHPGEVVATVHLADAAIASESIEAAAAAFTAWRRTPAPSRGEILRRASELIDIRAEDIGRDLTREEGKTLAEAVRETKAAAWILRYYAAQTLDPDGESYPSTRPSTAIYTRREALGVVSVITPWNFPILIASWKIGPALAFGNTVVWKPADLVPMTAIHLLQALVDAGLPAGVLNLVLGKGSQVGDVLSTHPKVAAITFTGSNTVGRRIQERAAALGKRVQLELGGKNPAIVLADADIDFAAEQVSRGAFLATGQKCTATSRVIVERSVIKEFVERLAGHAEALQLGDPLDPSTAVGPLVSADQLDSVLGYLKTAQREGARAVTGGVRGTGALGVGYFVTPTVLVDAQPAHTVVREEVFGPVTAVLPVSSYQEALAQANDTPFGLSASLFTNDLKKATHFSQEIRAGVVKINQETSGLEFHVPFGGVKESSSGSREQGKLAREFFTEWKTIYVHTP